MQSKNTKSMSRVGFIVILGVFFICMELMGEVSMRLGKASRCSYPVNAHYIKRSSPIQALNCMRWQETPRKFWKSGSSPLRYFTFTNAPRSAVDHGWKSGFRAPKGQSDGLKDRKLLIGIKH